MEKITVRIPKSLGYKLKVGDPVAMHGKVTAEDDKCCTAEMEMPDQDKPQPTKKKISPVEYLKRQRRKKAGLKSEIED